MMNKILVLYQSKYGATKKYAELLKNDLPCDIEETRNFKAIDFHQYDCIVFAGAIYASGIAGIKILRRNYNVLNTKKIAVFCVGASPYDEKALMELKAHNFKSDLHNIPLFYGRGAWDESKMTFKDRALCKLLQKAVAKKEPAACEPWMRALMSSIGQKCDWTEQKYLQPLIRYIKEED